MPIELRWWGRLAAVVPALLAATAALGQAQPAGAPSGDAGGGNVFTWFVILAVVAVIVFLVMSVGRRRRRVSPNPPRP